MCVYSYYELLHFHFHFIRFLCVLALSKFEIYYLGATILWIKSLSSCFQRKVSVSL